jgi:hypothetical protein
MDGIVVLLLFLVLALLVVFICGRDSGPPVRGGARADASAGERAVYV